MQNFDEREHFLAIIRKYIRREASESEADFIKQYYDKFEEEEDVLNTLSADERSRIEERIERSIITSIGGSAPKSRRWLWRAAAMAAMVVIMLSAGFYILDSYFDDAPLQAQERESNLTDIVPGSEKATLILADGSAIALVDVADGQIAVQAGVKITKEKSGQIAYGPSEHSEDGEEKVLFNTLVTPMGGKYQLILPDGTQVWLNAGSSLKYPTAFVGEERIVHLTGEGYFDVVKSDRMPFKVITEKQEIEVLGTIFNINSYADEPSTRTTLLEGKVRVMSRLKGSGGIGVRNEEMVVVLKPGEQCTLLDSGMSVAKVDTDAVTAWKDGIFRFDNSDVGSVMRQFSKWYNVPVEFEGNIPDVRFWGEMSRSVDVFEALQMLEYFDMRYKVVQTGTEKKIVIY